MAKSPATPRPTDAELAILRVLWQRGASTVRQVHEEGVRVIPWTVNEVQDWQRLIDWGVDGITTDYPDRLAEYLYKVGRQIR